LNTAAKDRDHACSKSSKYSNQHDGTLHHFLLWITLTVFLGIDELIQADEHLFLRGDYSNNNRHNTHNKQEDTSTKDYLCALEF
jgi:hypothetical protein